MRLVFAVACVWLLLAWRCTALEITGQTTSIIVVNGTAREVHHATIICDRTTRGVNNYTIQDPSGKVDYNVSINCQPPVYTYNLKLQGFIPRDVYGFERQVCLTSARPANSTSGTRAPALQSHNGRHSHVMSGHFTLPPDASLVGGAAIAGGIVGGALSTELGPVGFVLGAFVGNWLSAASFRRKQIAFDKQVTREFHDVGNELVVINNILKLENKNINANTEAIAGILGDIQGIDIADQEQDADISNMNDMIRYIARVQEQTQVETLRNLTALKAEIVTADNATATLAHTVFKITGELETRIEQLLRLNTGLARQVRQLSATAYADIMQTQQRRALNAMRCTDELAAAEQLANTPSLLTPYDSTAFVASDGQCNKPLGHVMRQESRPEGARRIAAVLVQGTRVLPGGARMAFQVEVGMYGDPLFVLDNYAPDNNARDLLELIGGVRPDGTSCSTDVSDADSKVEPRWSCRVVVAFTGIECELKDDYTYPYNTMEEAVNLRRVYEEGYTVNGAHYASGIAPAFCKTTGGSGGFVFPSDYEGVTSTSRVFIESPDGVGEELERLCLLTGDGAWEEWTNATGHTVNVRITRPYSQRYRDMYITNENGTCDGDLVSMVAKPADTLLNSFAYYVWMSMVRSYSAHGYRDMQNLETHIYGAFPSNTTFVEYPTSRDPSSGDNSARCFGYAYVRLPTTDDEDLNVLRVYQMEAQQGTSVQAGIRIIPADANVHHTTNYQPLHHDGSGEGTIADGKWNYYSRALLDNDVVNYLPTDQYIIETPEWWAVHELAFDVPYNDISLGPTASGNAHRTSYINIPATAVDVASQAKPHTISYADWNSHYHSVFDARLVGNAAQTFARVYDPRPDHLDCGNSVGAFSQDSQVLPPDNDLCALMRLYEIKTNTALQSGTQVQMIPRNGWRYQVTVSVPLGEFVSRINTACPEYTVDLGSDQVARVTLAALPTSTITVCVQVRRGPSSTPNVIDPSCGVDAPITAIIKGGSAGYTVPFQPNQDPGCTRQYMQVYEFKSATGSDSCTLADVTETSASYPAPCYADPGIALSHSSSGASGNNRTSTVIDSKISVVKDLVAASLVHISSSTSDLINKLQDLEDDDFEDNIAAMEAKVNKVLKDNLNNAQNLDVGNSTVLNKQISDEQAEIDSRSKEIAANIHKRQQARKAREDRVSASEAKIEQTEKRADTIHRLLRNSTKNIAGIQNDTDQLDKDLAAVEAAGSGFGSCFLFQFVCDITDGIGGIFSFLGDGIGDLINSILQFALMGLLIYLFVVCCLPELVSCCKSAGSSLKKSANRTKSDGPSYSSVATKEEQTPMVQRPRPTRGVGGNGAV